MKKIFSLLILLLCIAIPLVSCEVTIPEEDAKITGITYGGDAITLKEQGAFIACVDLTYEGKIDKTYFEFVSSDNTVATVEYEELVGGHLYILVVGVSEGECTVFVQTKDLSVKSEEISVVVTGDNNNGNGGDNTGNGGDNTGSGGDNTGSGGDNTGNGGDNNGSGDDNNGSGDDNTGSGDDNTGSGDDNTGSGDDNTGGGDDNTGGGDDNTGGGDDNTGSGDDNTGNGGDNNGSGDDNTGSGDDNTGSGDDNTGSGDDNTGSGDDNTGSGNDNTGSGDDNNGGDSGEVPEPTEPENPALTKPRFDLSVVPEYKVGDSIVVVINNNVPYFTKNQIWTTSYEYYSPLDNLGRAGIAVACIGIDLMPTDDRGSLSYSPSGWEGNNNVYDFVSGGYIYNRCHLIGWQLTAENNNKYNLITGTKFLNVGPSGDLEGMLDFENMVADYLKEFPENHVMYRVEPIYEGNNLLASGVHMEAWSVEDDGEGISFNVFIMNVQDGVIIDYSTGANRKDPSYVTGSEDNEITRENCTYIINSNTKKIHLPTCNSAPTTNAIYTDKTLDELLASGYTSDNFCKTCKPQNAKSLVRSYYYFDKRYLAA